MKHPITLAALTTLLAAATCCAAGRPADAILKDLAAVPEPRLDQAAGVDPAVAARQRDAYARAVAPLKDELIAAHPDHAMAALFVKQRLKEKLAAGTPRDTVMAEAEAFAAAHPKTPAAFAAMLLRTELATPPTPDGTTYAQRTAAVDAAAKFTAPNDPALDPLRLDAVVGAADLDRAGQIERLNALAAATPPPSNADDIRGVATRLAAVGKPFDLAFKDFVTGREVSTKQSAGRVVIVDVWATWCAPCLAALPAYETLYGRLHDKGVDMIGVSLDFGEDDGGKTALTRFLAARKLPWPTDYAGDGLDSPFAKTWGIVKIPLTFVVDRNGNLAAVETEPGAVERVVERLLGAEQP